MNLPGQSIPYSYTPAEVQQFVAAHAADSRLVSYLNVDHHNPPYGVLLHESYGDILVWFDASDRLHVVDITNMAVASQIDKAPYVAPDSSFFDNLTNDVAAKLDALPSKLPSVTTLVVIFVVVGGLLILADRKL